MTVQITKPGKTAEQRDPQMHARCTSCECEFTFQASDAAYVSDQRDGDYYQLPCPNCSKPVYRTAKAK